MRTTDVKKFINSKLPMLTRKCFTELKAYTPGEQPQNVQEWVKLNTNENPSEPIPEVVQALEEAIKLRLRMYPDPLAKDLREIIAQNFLSRYDSVKTAENILIANGSDETLDILFKTFVDPGDRVLYFSPSYGMYSTLTETYCGVKVVIPLDPVDFSIPNLNFTSKDKLLIICSPNNPNGDSVPLQKIEQIAQDFPGIVFVDEAYGDFADTTAITLLSKYPNLVIGRTYSKSSSLASIRLGYAFAHEEIIKLFNTVRLPYNVSYLTQVAGIAIMKNWPKIMNNVEAIKNERTRVISALTKLGYVVLPTQANFYLVKLANETAGSKIYFGLKERKILVRYWAKPGLSQFLRITVGSKAQNDKLINAMDELKALNK